MAQGPAMTANPGPPNVASVPGKVMTVFSGLHVAADQFVGLADADEFLHARHFVQRAGLDFAPIPGDADGGALRARHGVGPVAQLLDLPANRAICSSVACAFMTTSMDSSSALEFIVFPVARKWSGPPASSPRGLQDDAGGRRWKPRA